MGGNNCTRHPTLYSQTFDPFLITIAYHFPITKSRVQSTVQLHEKREAWNYFPSHGRANGLHYVLIAIQQEKPLNRYRSKNHGQK